MPLTERRLRFAAMMERLKSHTIHDWFSDFVGALRDSRIEKEAAESALPDPAILPTRRSAGPALRYY
jgi:trehalose 6-phosphate synthase